MTARPFLKRGMLLALTALTVVGLLAVIVLATARASARQRAGCRLVLHTHDVSDALRDTLTDVQDAETGQRGFLLTGSPRCLAPFTEGQQRAPADLDRLQALTHDNPAQQAQIARLRPLVAAKLAELQQTVLLSQTGQRPRALWIVRSGYGVSLMDAIRAEISQMQTVQSRLLSARMAAQERASRRTLLWVSAGLALVVVLLAGAGWSVISLLQQQNRAEERIHDYTLVLEFQKRELEKANAELEMLATTDGLTALKNHRAFQETLALQVSHAARYGQPLALLLLDVDRFKQYNDTHGHPAGDAVLRALARILQDCARDTDLIARYGGEEFVLLLPQTDLDSAMAFAERLRRAIEEHPWPLRAVTASFGVACLHLCEDHGTALIDRADKAMYLSKLAGRNRVSCAPDLVLA